MSMLSYNSYSARTHPIAYLADIVGCGQRQSAFVVVGLTIGAANRVQRGRAITRTTFVARDVCQSRGGTLQIAMISVGCSVGPANRRVVVAFLTGAWT